jgi:hypothetical protein
VLLRVENPLATSRSGASEDFTVAYANSTRIGHRFGVVAIFALFAFPRRNHQSRTDVRLGTRAGGPDVGRGRGDQFFAVAVDAEGNSYVTGAFTGTATFGAGEANETQLTAAGRDAVVAKYARGGQLVWVRQAGGPDPAGVDETGDVGVDIAVDASGNTYVIGVVSAPGAVFGVGEPNATTLPDSGGFLAKYSVDGTLVWAERVAAGTSSVALDQQGNVYLATTHCFLGKFDPSGTLIWSRQVTSTVDVGCTDITVDSQQNSYIAGGFRQDATFAHVVLEGTTNEFDIFLARYSPDGQLSFAVRAGGTRTDIATGVAVDRSGNAYLTGFFEQTAVFGTGARQTSLTSVPTPIHDDLLLAKYASDGNLTWVRHAEGPGTQSGTDLAVEEHAPFVGPDGSTIVPGSTLIYVITQSQEPLTFGPSQPNPAIYDEPGGFLAVYTGDGLFLSSQSMLGRYASPRGIAVGSHGVYVAGVFIYPVTFDSGNPGERTLTSVGSSNMFLARYSANVRLFLANVLDHVDFQVQSTSFDSSPVAGGPAGVFTITANLSNTGAQYIFIPVRVIVHTLTGGNVLLSATQGDGTAGSRQDVDVGGDNALAPGESIPVVFRVGLATRRTFTFLVDVEGGIEVVLLPAD